MFGVQLIVRLLISQLDAVKGGPKIGSGNMMNRPRGPPVIDEWMACEKGEKEKKNEKRK